MPAIQEDIPSFGLYASCHAATVCVHESRLLVAYFGGPYEGHRRTAIWISISSEGVWEAPRKVADGKVCTGMERACWNPVFFRFNDCLKLYFKVGASPQNWRGYEMESPDWGHTWSHPAPLPPGILGPTKNPPIHSGPLVVSGSSDERSGCALHFELTTNGHHWNKVFPASHLGLEGCIQPAILDLGEKHLLALARSSMGFLVQTRSRDGGRTWGTVETTVLPNPDSAICTLSLAPGRHVLAYNHSTMSRTPLVLAISADGTSWRDTQTIASGDGEFSYPALDFDGRAIWLAYTVNRTAIRLAKIVSDDLFRPHHQDGPLP